MRMHHVLALLFLSAAVPFSQAQPSKQAGAKREDSSWNTLDAETIKALLKKADARNGAVAYEICAACHQPSGAGRSDGTFPQLAGQHATVLVKQMADINAGRRTSPKMYPFVMTLAGPLELADVAAHISSLCIPSEHGRYDGPNVSRQLALGKELYEKGCAACHGKSGEGAKDKFYPVLAGQHYIYLLRQMRDIREGKRHNANTDMVKLIGTYSDNNLQEISAYQSNLEVPGAMCKP